MLFLGIIGLDMSSRSLLHELAAHHKLNADTFSLCFGRSGGFLGSTKTGTSLGVSRTLCCI